MDQVPALAAGLDEAPRFAYVQPHARGLEQAAGETGAVPAHQVRHLRVDLHRVHLPGRVIERAQHVGAAPGAEDQGPGPPEQVER